MVRVAINGFGRIGRLCFRLMEEDPDYEVVAINDLTDAAVGDKEIINNRFNMKFEDGKNKMDMVLTYTSNYSLNLIPYVNTGLTEKGPHITQVKTIITKEFKE